MQIQNEALVLIADGRKLLFLRNKGDAAIPDLRVESHHEQDNPRDRDQSGDAPSRAFSSVVTARSATEETDFHQLKEDRFAVEAAEMLRKRVLADDFEQLIIAAPPGTLSELRKHYHKEVEQRLTGEVSEDLTNMPIPDIERVLTE